MYPRLLPGAIVLLDRHYNSLQPYRKGELNIYAVHAKGQCKLRYVEVSGASLILRPHNQSHSVEIISMAEGEHLADYVVGRACYVGMEM